MATRKHLIYVWSHKHTSKHNTNTQANTRSVHKGESIDESSRFDGALDTHDEMCSHGKAANIVLSAAVVGQIYIPTSSLDIIRIARLQLYWLTGHTSRLYTLNVYFKSTLVCMESRRLNTSHTSVLLVALPHDQYRDHAHKGCMVRGAWFVGTRAAQMHNAVLLDIPRIPLIKTRASCCWMRLAFAIRNIPEYAKCF